MADLSKIKLNGTEYDIKDSFARNSLHIIKLDLTGDTYNNFPVGQLNCSQEELKNYYKNGLCIFQYKKDEDTYYFQISDYDSTLSQMYSNYFSETLDIYNIYGIITLDMDGGFFADANMIAVKSDGTCFIISSHHLIPYITDHSSKGIYDLVTGELDISNLVMNSDLATVATSGNYNDLINKPTVPEDKLFLVNVTMNSMTSGTSDKSSAEIAAAVNAGKLPIVKTGMGQMSMMATLVNIEETQEDGETYYSATFMYNDENADHTRFPSFITKAVMIISGNRVTLQVKPGSYITDRELNEKGYLTSYTETDPTVPAWAKQANKPTYSFSELTSHPTTINDYGITDAYTKTEINGLVSGVLHYKGTKVNVSALPSSGNVTGDVWHITADGSEWAWDGSDWQELGTTVDLSGYLQTGDIAAWAKAANKPTYTASEVGALSSSTTFVSSFNGNSGAITYTAPVTSVNGRTGAVTVAEYDDTALAARVSALEQIPWVTYYTGSSTPSNSQGNDGDLYFQTAQ